jgi:hypothetical protein
MAALWRRGVELEDDGGCEEEEPRGRAKDNTLEGRFGGQWSQDRVCGVRSAGTEPYYADSTALDEQYGRAVRSRY